MKISAFWYSPVWWNKPIISRAFRELDVIFLPMGFYFHRELTQILLGMTHISRMFWSRDFIFFSSPCMVLYINYYWILVLKNILVKTSKAIILGNRWEEKRIFFKRSYVLMVSYISLKIKIYLSFIPAVAKKWKQGDFLITQWVPPFNLNFIILMSLILRVSYCIDKNSLNVKVMKFSKPYLLHSRASVPVICSG